MALDGSGGAVSAAAAMQSAATSMRCSLQSPFAGSGLYSSRNSSFKGCQHKLNVPRGAPQVVMMKKDIHPKYYDDAKVICNGEEVLTISGTQKEYNVDVWSGNHPFFQGATSTVVVDEGRVNRFKRRFAGLEKLSAISTISGGMMEKPTKAELLKAMGKSPAPKKGKGKK